MNQTNSQLYTRLANTVNTKVTRQNQTDIRTLTANDHIGDLIQLKIDVSVTRESWALASQPGEGLLLIGASVIVERGAVTATMDYSTPVTNGKSTMLAVCV